MSKKYIHYGHRVFDRETFRPIRNALTFTKPYGGFWASPVDAVFGWKEWCDRENFRECRKNRSFTFTLSENARVITIASMDGLKALAQVEDELSPMDWVLLDFEELRSQGWDAIEVSLTADPRLYWALYGWDCDSILILNPDVIVEV